MRSHAFAGEARGGAAGGSGNSTASSGSTLGAGDQVARGPASNAAPCAADGPPQKEYSFWQSAEVLASRREAPRLIGR